jgi:hypothetical protein
MDLSPSYDPIAASLGEVLRPILLIGILAIPLGWVLACIGLWRPLPHLFVILSRWFGGINAAISALMLLVVGISFAEPYGLDGMKLGFLAASVSGMLAWIVVGRRSGAQESWPSLL